ncbi:MAG TPA: membrane protein insertion efficiency factor YidD [Jatrophihabitans sp.]|jgi:hypothetical protein|uniref:membrane protein insertion efficiency factor YidD n=1 Tax=Jatrophihabitans sp. TaxID=1932789 RepID=UPI002E0A1061|nr:membrane protein insertion efficiency factor YidD [Jatrophihabitans sp.]
MARSFTARVLLGCVRFYRMAISPLRPPSCRYVPTCSEYAVEAIEMHGAGRGVWLALRRLLRCHPFHAGGHDPVPPSVGGRERRRDRKSSPDPVLLTTSSRSAA